MMDPGIDVGVEMTIWCEPTSVEIASFDRTYFIVQWPWLTSDSQSRFKWDGLSAFPRNAAHHEWMWTPWRFHPDVSTLHLESSCMMSIPRTRVIVREVEHYEPPHDLGWLPRPTVGMLVVPLELQDNDEAGYMIYGDGGEPIQISVD